MSGLFLAPVLGFSAPMASGRPSGIVFIGGYSHRAGDVTGGVQVDIPLTTLTGGLEATPQPDDYVIVAISGGGTANFNWSIVSSDWTTVADRYSNDNRDSNMLVALKKMGEVPDTTFSFTSDVTAGLVAAVHVWGGVDGTTPMDVAAVDTTGTDTGQANPPAITPTTAGSIVIAVGTGSGSALSDPTNRFTSSDLSNFVARLESANAIDSLVGIGSITWTSGAVNPAQFGGGSGSANDAWCAVSMALRPAA